MGSDGGGRGRGDGLLAQGVVGDADRGLLDGRLVGRLVERGLLDLVGQGREEQLGSDDDALARVWMAEFERVGDEIADGLVQSRLVADVDLAELCGVSHKSRSTT